MRPLSVSSARSRRALVLWNRKAGGGKRDISPILDRMQAAGFVLAVDDNLDKSALKTRLLHERKETGCVVICGGDGTVRSAAAGIVEADLPMGILPMGTANDLARTLGIPSDLGKAADVIIGGTLASIDVGMVNDEPFLNVASLGLSTELARGLTRDAKKRWGRFSYAIAASRIVISMRPFTAWISSETEGVRVRTLQIAVGNGRFYGGGNVIEESASIDDGELDLYSLELKTVLKLAVMLPWFRQGTHGTWKEVRTKRGAGFAVETQPPRSINADGELVTQTPARFRILPKAMRVYVPVQT